MKTLRFAFSGGDREVEQLLPLTNFLTKETGVLVMPTPLPTYPALVEALRSEWCALGWLPPLVGHDLSICRTATPLVVASRDGGSTYFAGFIASERSRIWHLGQLAGKHVGWVSKLSAAGYVVPRLHLASIGLLPENLFASEKIYGSHHAVRSALESGCDVVATYLEMGPGEEAICARVETPHRIVAVSGPIPSDVISASVTMTSELRDRIFRALLAFEADPTSALVRNTRLARFAPVPASHWCSLERWQDRSRRESDRVTRAFETNSTAP